MLGVFLGGGGVKRFERDIIVVVVLVLMIFILFGLFVVVVV